MNAREKVGAGVTLLAALTVVGLWFFIVPALRPNR